MSTDPAATFLAQFPDLLLKTLLYPLVALLVPAAHDDRDKAWASARETILLYDPRTELEFRLAVRTAVFNIQSLQAAANANLPGLSMAGIARQQAHAVSMAREADKAERRLEKLQATRRETEESGQVSERPQTSETAPPMALKDEVRMVKEFARKNKLPYAQVWSQYLLAKRGVAQGTGTAPLPQERVAASAQPAQQQQHCP